MKRSSSFSVSRRGVLAASTVGALGVAVVAVPMLAISASATPSSGSDDHKVTICHRDNDEKKPYVKETVDIASTGLLKSGHNGHTGDVFAPGMKADHDKWGDIIPPYTYKSFTFAGLNWDADGQAIYKAGCKVVVATPTETESEDPSPQESTPATDPSAEESSPATDPSPVESSPATDPSPVESSPATDPSPEDSSNGGPQGSGSPSPEESSSTPVDPATPSDTTTDPGLPSTGGNGTTLPKTGSDTAALLGLAAGLVTMGAASIVVARRRTEVETD